MLIDLVNQVKSANALVPAVYAATSQGSAIDMSNAKISTGAIVDCGAFGANTTSVVVQIEESTATNTGWVAIPNMVVTVTTSNQHQVVRGLRTNRYVRANAITVAGTTPAVALSVEVIAELEYAGTGGGYSRSPST